MEQCFLYHFIHHILNLRSFVLRKPMQRIPNAPLSMKVFWSVNTNFNLLFEIPLKTVKRGVLSLRAAKQTTITGSIK